MEKTEVGRCAGKERRKGGEKEKLPVAGDPLAFRRAVGELQLEVDGGSEGTKLLRKEWVRREPRGWLRGNPTAVRKVSPMWERMLRIAGNSGDMVFEGRSKEAKTAD